MADLLHFKKTVKFSSLVNLKCVVTPINGAIVKKNFACQNFFLVFVTW